MADRVERLTNLLALLLETIEPLSLVEIAAELDAQYPDTDVARRQAFERDKQALRELGVPIDTEILAGGPYAGQTRYRIDRDKYELTDLELEPDKPTQRATDGRCVRADRRAGRVFRGTQSTQRPDRIPVRRVGAQSLAVAWSRLI